MAAVRGYDARRESTRPAAVSPAAPRGRPSTPQSSRTLMSLADRFRRRGSLLAFLLALAAPALARAQPQPVVGMRVMLQPPEGFIPAARFAGFQREEARASIMVAEVPAPFSLMETRLTPQSFTGEGMQLRSSEPFAVDSLHGRLLAVTQAAPDGLTYHKWVLMFGDDSVTAIVTATYPEASAASLGEPMKQAVLSSRWSAAPADRMAGLGFRVTEGRLRLAHRVGNAILLNESGSTATPTPGAPLLVVGSSVAEVDLSDVEAFARRRIAQMEGVSGFANLAGASITVDGGAAYELIGDAVDAQDGTPVKVYQVIIPEGSHFILIQGFMAADRVADFIPEFQAVARSLRRAR